MIDLIYEVRDYACKKNPEFVVMLSEIENGLKLGEKSSYLFENQDNTKNDEDMFNYYCEIRSIGTSLSYINGMIEEIRINKQNALMTTSSKKDEELSDNLSKILDETHKKTIELKENIEYLRAKNDDFKRRANKNETAEIMIRENLLQAISRRFRETISEFQSVQSEYKHDMKNKILRQIKIVYPDASQNTIDAITEEDVNIATTQLIKMKLSGSHETLGNAIQDLQDRYKDIRRLERSVDELQQLFIELASLINVQGEILDHIEFSISNAKDYTEKAEIELISARKHQRKAQKKMAWIILCLFILILVVILPTILGVALNNSSR